MTLPDRECLLKKGTRLGLVIRRGRCEIMKWCECWSFAELLGERVFNGSEGKAAQVRIDRAIFTFSGVLGMKEV